jgi:hypothetical protein
MTDAQLRAIARLIENEGPNRVVVSPSGEATTSRRAREDHGIFPTTIFIRDDLWSLGTPRQFEQIAYKLGEREWIARMMLADDEWRLFRMDGLEVP